MKPRDFDKEIADLKAKLAGIEQEKAKFEALTPEQRLADILHGILCRHNHADACGYLYESWDQPGNERMRETRRARRLLQLVDGNVKLAEEIAKALDSSRY